MKDTATAQNEPWRISRWIEIALEEVKRYADNPAYCRQTKQTNTTSCHSHGEKGKISGRFRRNRPTIQR